MLSRSRAGDGSEEHGANNGLPRPMSCMTEMIRYENQIAAFAGGRTRHLVPPFSDLPADDPQLRIVELMCAIALACNRGLIPGPYSDEQAARLARTLLIGDDEFVAHGDEDDELLAERFGVPVREIARKRHDLALWRAERSSQVVCCRSPRVMGLSSGSRREHPAQPERRSRHRDRRRRGYRRG